MPRKIMIIETEDAVSYYICPNEQTLHNAALTVLEEWWAKNGRDVFHDLVVDILSFRSGKAAYAYLRELNDVKVSLANCKESVLISAD